MVAAIISFKSMKDSKLAAKQSALNSTVTASRDKWSYALRENVSLYFTQIARLCNGQETDLQAIYNELTRYHFSIVFLLSSQHDDDVRIHDCMSAIRSKALEIVEISKSKSLSPEVAQKSIENLRLSIWKEYGDEVFNGITFLIDREWERQKHEATLMWEKQAHDRVKERKARTRQLIQKGAIVESAMPETNSMTLDELARYLRGLSEANSGNRTVC